MINLSWPFSRLHQPNNPCDRIFFVINADRQPYVAALLGMWITNLSASWLTSTAYFSSNNSSTRLVPKQPVRFFLR